MICGDGLARQALTAPESLGHRAAYDNAGTAFARPPESIKNGRKH